MPIMIIFITVIKMRILDRYLLTEFLKPFGYCLGGFLVFWITFQLFSELDEFQKAGLGVVEIIHYFIATMPELLSRVIPLSLLLGMLYALNNHARYNEIVAIRSAGISLWRISIPYFIVAAFCGGFLFFLNEYIMPDSADRTEAILKGYSKNALTSDIVHHLTFKNTRHKRTWIIEEYNLKTHQMKSPHIEWVSTNNTLYAMKAERGVRSNNVWTFFNVQLLVYPPGDPVPGRGYTNILQVPEFVETPEQIKSEIKISSLTDYKQIRGAQLSLKEILEYQHWHPEARNNPMLNTKFHIRLSGPFTCLVIVLIAIPFGAAYGRRNVYVGVATSVSIGFAYFVLQRLGEAAGIGGHINPALAGWLPNIVFALLGIIMVLRVR